MTGKIASAKANLRGKARRLSYKVKNDYFSADGLIIGAAVILCLYWAWGAISSMSRNWELEQRLDTRKKELTLLRLEVETLELENQYYRSEEYQELAARRQQNKMAEGEQMVLLPTNSEYARTKYRAIEHPEPAPKSNLEQWRSFLFGV